jgi:hypothetical protein
MHVLHKGARQSFYTFEARLQGCEKSNNSYWSFDRREITERHQRTCLSVPMG